MNNVLLTLLAVLLTVLAVLLAAVISNTVTAKISVIYNTVTATEENYQERREEEARLAHLEPEARSGKYRARLDTYRADQLRGSMEAREGGSFRGTRSVSFFDETEAQLQRRAGARLDGDSDSGENLFGALPP